MREQLIKKYYEILSGFVIKLEFRKMNGEIRYACCTRKDELIPDLTNTPSTFLREDKQTDRIFAYDLEQGHWIQFSVDNVLELIDITMA